MSVALLLTADELRQVVRDAVREELRAFPSSRPAGEWLSTEEVATEMGVQPKTVRVWIANGLPATRRGRRLVIARAALVAWRCGEPTPATGLVSTLTPRGQ